MLQFSGIATFKHIADAIFTRQETGSSVGLQHASQEKSKAERNCRHMNLQTIEHALCHMTCTGNK